MNINNKIDLYNIKNINEYKYRIHLLDTTIINENK